MVDNSLEVISPNARSYLSQSGQLLPRLLNVVRVVVKEQHVLCFSSWSITTVNAMENHQQQATIKYNTQPEWLVMVEFVHKTKETETTEATLRRIYLVIVRRVENPSHLPGIITTFPGPDQRGSLNTRECQQVRQRLQVLLAVKMRTSWWCTCMPYKNISFQSHT